MNDSPLVRDAKRRAGIEPTLELASKGPLTADALAMVKNVQLLLSKLNSDVKKFTNTKGLEMQDMKLLMAAAQETAKALVKEMRL